MVHGILYKSLCVVVTGLDDEVDPQFGQIEAVIIVNSIYFNVKLFHFSDHYQSYVVTLTSQFTTHLTYHITPLHARTITGLTGLSQKAIILKHIVSTL